MKKFSNIWLGLAVCVGIAIVGFLLGKLAPVVGGPVFAILIGMCIALFWKTRDMAQPGIQFSSKIILQLAVVLLGFGMNLSDIIEKGRQSLPVIAVTISVALILSYILYRAMKMQPRISILIGVGSSICGGSAIAAAAPVIGATDEEIAQSISVIFLFNVAAAIIFPSLGAALGLSNEGFGLFAGSAVNDTSSVTAAATAWDGMHASNTLDDATIVKLTRTLAIIPITLVLAFMRTQKEKRAAEHSGVKISLKKIFPFFILFFLLASIITTVFSLPSTATAPLKEASKFLIITAMAAIGLNTDIVKLVKTGGKPILMGFCCWVAITLSCLAMQSLIHMW